jgi:hypothetical protein
LDPGVVKAVCGTKFPVLLVPDEVILFDVYADAIEETGESGSTEFASEI